MEKNFDKYLDERISTEDVQFDHFENEIKYDATKRMFFVDIVPVDEESAIKDSDDIEKIADRESIDHDAAKKLIQELHSNRKKIFNSKSIPEYINLLKKFNVDTDSRTEYFHTDVPHVINLFSATKINIPLGEGILDFCYTDFNKKINEINSFFKFYQESNVLFNYSEEQNNIESSIKFNNIYNAAMVFGDRFFYSSLYSAIFPPLFLTPKDDGLKHYLNYIFSLQKEFIGLIEFCFDKEFYPKVLGEHSPAARYSIYTDIFERSSEFSRKESFNVMQISDFNDNEKITPELKEFAKKYDILPEFILFNTNASIQISYLCTNIYDMLMLEFTKMLENNITFTKCKNCGRYFISKGNYESNYCNRIIEGSNKTCQQFAAQKNYKNKISSDEAWKAYNKYYKRYFARAKVGTIKQPDFKKWQYEATFKRDECLAGRLSIEEYVEWLDESFKKKHHNLLHNI